MTTAALMCLHDSNVTAGKGGAKHDAMLVACASS